MTSSSSRNHGIPLRSLAPQVAVWVTIVAIAAVAAYWQEQQKDEEEVFVGTPSETSSMTSLTRWLWESSDSGRQQQPPMYSEPTHVHPPVYNEEHKPLFPLDRRDFWGFDLAILGLMIAAGGGIGGGGILVPIYILVLGFTPKHAIPLSNITVFGGALANTLLNARKRHPLANRPLVDWDLILVMEPLTIAGALLGAFLNKLLPVIFISSKRP